MDMQVNLSVYFPYDHPYIHTQSGLTEGIKKKKSNPRTNQYIPKRLKDTYGFLRRVRTGSDGRDGTSSRGTERGGVSNERSHFEYINKRSRDYNRISCIEKNKIKK